MTKILNQIALKILYICAIAILTWVVNTKTQRIFQLHIFITETDTLAPFYNV